MAFTQIAEIWSEKLIMGYSLKHNKYESLWSRKTTRLWRRKKWQKVRSEIYGFALNEANSKVQWN